MSDNALYGRRWKKAARLFLLHNPLCCECSTDKRPVRANTVDHKVAHKGDLALFWDQSNWQPMCATCHSIKTASEDGGFGNKGTGRVGKACGVDGLPSDKRHHWNG